MPIPTWYKNTRVQLLEAVADCKNSGIVVDEDPPQFKTIGRRRKDSSKYYPYGFYG
jgi:hypothetical protein